MLDKRPHKTTRSNSLLDGGCKKGGLCVLNSLCMYWVVVYDGTRKYCQKKIQYTHQQTKLVHSGLPDMSVYTHTTLEKNSRPGNTRGATNTHAYNTKHTHMDTILTHVLKYPRSTSQVPAVLSLRFQLNNNMPM